MYIDYFQNMSLAKKYFSKVDEMDIKSRGDEYHRLNTRHGVCIIKSEIIKTEEAEKSILYDLNKHSFGYPLRGEFFDCTTKDSFSKKAVVSGRVEHQNMCIILDESKHGGLLPHLINAPTDEMGILSLVAIDARFLDCLDIENVVEILSEDKNFYLKLMLAKDKALHNILTSEENFSSKKDLEQDLKFRQKYVKEISVILRYFDKHLKRAMKNQLEKNKGMII